MVCSIRASKRLDSTHGGPRAFGATYASDAVSKGGRLVPERETLRRARRDKRQGKAPSTQAGEFVREEIDHIREGKHGARSAKQAIAIGLSKARRAGVKLPPPKPGRASARTRKQAARDNRRARSAKSAKSSRKRSAAALRALKKESRAAASHRALATQARRAARRRPRAARSRQAKRAARTRKARRASRQAIGK
jgi:hypothetical protein